LGYKTDITNIFKPDIYRFVGDTAGFRAEMKLVISAESAA
jgi:hypothetical protein